MHALVFFGPLDYVLVRKVLPGYGRRKAPPNGEIRTMATALLHNQNRTTPFRLIAQSRPDYIYEIDIVLL